MGSGKIHRTKEFFTNALRGGELAVKVVDIFGNDTITIVEVSVGGRKNGEHFHHVNPVEFDGIKLRRIRHN